MKKGQLAFVLHTHLPFVHHPESEKVMEERWLFEAVTESYLPLLNVFHRLEQDGVPFRITMSLTPTLLLLLASPLLQRRYLHHLNQQIALAEKETKRLSGDPRFGPLARLYRDRFRELHRLYTIEYGGDLIGAFRRLRQAGRLELLTSSATHAFLPYVKTEQAIRVQLEQAIALHTGLLGERPDGIWLPECGYREGLDRLMAEYGLRYFFTDSHAVEHAYPQPAKGLFAPVRTLGGPLAFARDKQASSQVWSSIHGYPGDSDYREFYRDIAYEREEEYISPHLHGSGLRLDSGLKYYRITGQGEQKEPYKPQWAEGKAAEHARHFVDRMEERLRQAPHGEADPPPMIVASYDTELFGHWWYEGPIWLERVCREIAERNGPLSLAAPADTLDDYAGETARHVGFSSWGRGGYGDVWLNDKNAWMYRGLHRMEEEMIRLADSFPDETGLRKRALDQAGRELLLAQSSDWAFILDGGTVVDYALGRFRRHMARFRKLAEAVRSDSIEERWLAEVEKRDAVAPAVDYRSFRSPQIRQDAVGSQPIEALDPAAGAGFDWAHPEEGDDLAGACLDMAGPASRIRGVGPKKTPERLTAKPGPGGLRHKVLLLAWEFPPMVVGGLSRHVFELSRKLSALGHEVHVLTTHVAGYPAYEVNDGVQVHRIETYQSRELDFMDWVFQLNLRMVDYGRALIGRYGPFDLLHAHDWLVGHAAKALKREFGLPLAATIHATEFGRNQGLHSELQRRIHSLEWELTYEASRVIACSDYMNRELIRLFELPPEKVAVIPNGIDPATLQPDGDLAQRSRYALPHEKLVLFIGRLVREKGVQVLIDSIPSVLAACPEAKFVIGGKGPMREELQRRAEELGVADRVLFPGFVDDESRNRLFAFSAAAVFPSLYEPFGIVALEAMAAGVPVIVSGIGGLQEIVEHGRDGFTVLPGDARSLSAHLIRLLQHEGNAREMARRAYAKVCKVYDWSQIAEQTVDAYAEARNAAEPLNRIPALAVSEG